MAEFIFRMVNNKDGIDGNGDSTSTPNQNQ